MTNRQHGFFATAPRGAEDLLAAELEDIGAGDVRARTGGVEFRGPLEIGYRACLWSRVASRVLLELAELSAASGDALYADAKALDWAEQLEVGASFAIQSGGRPAPGSDIDNTHFAALRVKDAIVDQLRERRGERPNVDLDAPDLRLRLHLRGDRAALSVDLSGEGLHRRGYRVASVAAPLRENLAAAVVLRAGWRRGEQVACVDPMCGSGTLLIEAAWISGDVAPGLLRERWGFAGWAGHDAELWARLRGEAEARREAARSELERLSFVGYDGESSAVAAAIACVEAAGLHGVVHVERRALAEVEAPKVDGPGLLVCNPPWGERLGQRRALESLYAALGQLLRDNFVGWEAAILTGEPALGRHIGIRADRRNKLHDGPIACQILRMDLDASALAAEDERQRGKREDKREQEPKRERSEGARAFANRLAKNRKRLKSWLKREAVSCYRIYDADIPEYNFAIDFYRAVERDGTRGPLHAHVQEYAPPRSVDAQQARSRRSEALAVIREDFDLPRERVHVKRRERQRGSSQYEKLEDGRSFVVDEDGARLWVDLDSYLDTGLFLDHRPLRLRIADLAEGKRFLNLFCYTGAVTVHAARGGAKQTTSVDLSRTYLEWAKRNLALNGFDAAGPDDEPARRGRRAAHSLVRADVLEWLRVQGALRWELILCDPPSFSNSKRMRESFDVQRDHVELIRRSAALLAPEGTLIFSTNRRRFELDEAGLAGLAVEPLRDTVPPDFARTPDIHRCWTIRR